MYDTYDKNEIYSLLKEAKDKDKNFKQFGSRKHQYELNPCIKAKDVISIEKKYNFKLPEDYFWFITEVGNGGAGPYYGIIKFGENSNDTYEHAGKDNILSIKRTDEEYKKFIFKYEDESNNLTIDEFDKLKYELHQGMISVGTQGCCYNMQLITAGQNYGKIMYIDWGYYENKPFLIWEKNFVEWYKRWLIETIRGYNMWWYGYKMGGDENDLINKYLDSNDIEFKEEIIFSMYKFYTVSETTYDKLNNICKKEKNDKLKELIADFLLKFKNKVL